MTVVCKQVASLRAQLAALVPEDPRLKEHLIRSRPGPSE